MNGKTFWLKHFDFFLVDELCVVISFLLSYYLRHKSFSFFSYEIYRESLLVILIINIFLYLFIEPFKDVFKRGYLVEIKETLILCITNLLLFVLYLYIKKIGAELSRITLLLTYVFYFITSYSLRIVRKKYLREKSIESIKDGQKSLLIICDNNTKELIGNIIDNNYDFYRISEIFNIDDSDNDLEFTNLLDYISHNWIDDILIISDYNKLPEDIVGAIKDSGIPVHIKLNNIELFKDKKQDIDVFNGIDVISISSVSHNQSQLIVKRIIDFFGGLTGCFITVILAVLIGPIIYIKSPGPIIYVSDRVGKNGRIFRFYKFRSMVIDADDLKDQLKKENRVKDGMMFKVEDDPRIIPGIGNFIRKTSLDEFPQFFNVLKGDMSLVGTRPPTLDEWKKYTPYYRSRLSMKPGITGLWQVSGRSNIT